MPKISSINIINFYLEKIIKLFIYFELVSPLPAILLKNFHLILFFLYNLFPNIHFILLFHDHQDIGEHQQILAYWYHHLPPKH